MCVKYIRCVFLEAGNEFLNMIQFRFALSLDTAITADCFTSFSRTETFRQHELTTNGTEHTTTSQGTLLIGLELSYFMGVETRG